MNSDTTHGPLCLGRAICVTQSTASGPVYPMNTHDPPGPGLTLPVAPTRARESFAWFTPTPVETTKLLNDFWVYRRVKGTGDGHDMQVVKRSEKGFDFCYEFYSGGNSKKHKVVFHIATVIN